jgi:hypothetical protein
MTLKGFRPPQAAGFQPAVRRLSALASRPVVYSRIRICARQAE